MIYLFTLTMPQSNLAIGLMMATDPLSGAVEEMMDLDTVECTNMFVQTDAASTGHMVRNTMLVVLRCQNGLHSYRLGEP